MKTSGDSTNEEVVSASNGRFRVNVIIERCKECGLCIALCPAKVLVKGNEVNSRGFRYTIPANIKACIGCRICETHCPDFAIFVEEVRNE